MVSRLHVYPSLTRRWNLTEIPRGCAGGYDEAHDRPGHVQTYNNAFWTNGEIYPDGEYKRVRIWRLVLDNDGTLASNRCAWRSRMESTRNSATARRIVNFYRYHSLSPVLMPDEWDEFGKRVVNAPNSHAPLISNYERLRMNSRAKAQPGSTLRKECVHDVR